MRIRTNPKAAIIFVSAIGILLSLPVLAARRGQVLLNAAPESKPKPSPEIEKLHFYLGEWNYTETYPKSGLIPYGGKNTGLYTSKLGPGGNSLINTFHSQGPVGDFEGLLIMTWDPKEKAYKCYVFGDGFPGAVVETGQFEGDALVLRSELAIGATTMKTRNVTRLTTPGKMEIEEYTAVDDAPEKLLVHVDVAKK